MVMVVMVVVVVMVVMVASARRLVPWRRGLDFQRVRTTHLSARSDDHVMMRMMLGWDDGSYGKFQGRRKQAATENSAATRMMINFEQQRVRQQAWAGGDMGWSGKTKWKSSAIGAKGPRTERRGLRERASPRGGGPGGGQGGGAKTGGRPAIRAAERTPRAAGCMSKREIRQKN